ncbi:hypothetical protein Q5424_03355 [Conexibacter sp. JD483]|uniref:hypothetical protein n=1 Tax=unclassified Conexibacter TaxID=2627773 RepID=UPI0027217A5B|nr:MULTISPECIES: hypothetical protein [unclassified Conexibacter]MDO8184456.1 hypothetical protein [Conexibacter sp. CPCC 205706]MDO8197762.1 hypothetical protein [Conexibacter sp. CPCC 205762]MDR9368102.1 hypothetical protein [Conexibacter sp. JD483]
MAAGAVVVVLVLLVVLVRGCVNSGREQALKDYNRDVTTLMEESRDVSSRLFSALEGAASQRGEQVTETIAQLRAVAERDYERARGLDAPEAVGDAQHNLELLLSLREDGVRVIADRIQQATGSTAAAQNALRLIAGQMQAFNASDVIYSQRVAPYIKKALEDNGIPATYSGETGETVLPYADFLPNIGWMDPVNVARALGTSSASADADTGRPAPGLHGHQLDSVSVGGTTLEPGASTTLPASPPPSFDVAFTNGGEHDEQNVRVVVEISGGGSSSVLRAETTVPTTTAGQATTATVQFDRSPPTGGAAEIRVKIEGVPGETGLDNNSQTYSALFE